jgi:NADH:ubiquinone oxidoreductase subunit F (NADH-binding)
MAKMARFSMEFCANESCGKCTPCRIGSVRGMETIDKIRTLPTGNKSGMQNVPLTPITINSVRILK